MSDLFAVYGLDWTQYFTAATANINAIKQCELRYNNIIISWMLIINATLSKLKEHQDVILDEPAQVVIMIMKQDQQNKQGPKNNKCSLVVFPLILE